MYIKTWFRASSAIEAPAGDLSFLKGLASFPDIVVAKATSKETANHLWYFSEELAGFALFDRTLAVDVKRKIVAAFGEEGKDSSPPRAQVDLAAKEILDRKTVADFVTAASQRIFERFYVNMDFLAKDPSELESDSSSQRMKF